MKKIKHFLLAFKEEIFLFFLQALLLALWSMSEYFSVHFIGLPAWLFAAAVTSLAAAQAFKKTEKELQSAVLIPLCLVLSGFVFLTPTGMTAAASVSSSFFVLSLILIFAARKMQEIYAVSAAFCCLGGLVDRSSAVVFLPFLALVFVCEALLFGEGKTKKEKLYSSLPCAASLVVCVALVLISEREFGEYYFRLTDFKEAFIAVLPCEIFVLMYFACAIAFTFSQKTGGRRSYALPIYVLFELSALLPYFAVFYFVADRYSALSCCAVSLMLRLAAILYLTASGDPGMKKAVTAVAAAAKKYWPLFLIFLLYALQTMQFRIPPSTRT